MPRFVTFLVMAVVIQALPGSKRAILGNINFHMAFAIGRSAFMPALSR